MKLNRKIDKVNFIVEGSAKVNMDSNNEIIYVLKKTWQYDKKVFAFMSLYTVCDFAIPYIHILLPYYIINDYQCEKDSCIIFMKLLCSVVLVIFLGLAKDYARKEFWPRVIQVRKECIHQLDELVMTMKFIYTEDVDVLDKIEKASEALVSNEQGIEGILNRIFRVGGSMISFCIYSIIIIRFSLLVYVCLLVSGIFVYRLTQKLSEKKYDKLSELYVLGRKLKYVYNIMSDKKYAKDVRSYKLSTWFQKKQGVLIKERNSILDKVEAIKINLAFLSSMDGLLKSIIIYVFVVYGVLNESISIAEFTLYSSVLLTFSEALRKLLQCKTELSEQSKYIRDYMDLVEENSWLFEKRIKEDKNFLLTNIKFANVSFSYPKSSDKILNEITFKIEQGEKIALVGRNGAGKTTLVKLLTGLYSPTGGTIYINEIPLNQYGNLSYRMFSVIFQESKIFAFSIKENIVLECDYKEEENVKEVLNKVGLSKIYQNGLEKSISKILDEGGLELSGGELQRFVTARAIFKNAPVIIFDEPTASLDPISEDAMYKNFASITANKTVIFISHRLASTRFCDRIMFIDAGKITEIGTHEELIQQQGDYAKLFNEQAKYYV